MAGNVQAKLQVFLAALAAVVITASLATAYDVDETELLSFKREVMALNKVDGNEAKLKALDEAISKRPGHPLNIIFEYQKARFVPAEERAAVCEEIVSRYSDVSYYERYKDLTDESPWFDAEIIVPQAASFVAEKASEAGDGEKAREYVKTALKCMEKTFSRRKEDWANVPEPERPGQNSGVLEQEKYEKQVRNRARIVESMAEGEVFTNLERHVIQDQFNTYVETYAGRSSEMRAGLLGEFVKEYAGTAIADIALEYMDVEQEKTLGDLGKVVVETGMIEAEEVGEEAEEVDVSGDEVTASVEAVGQVEEDQKDVEVAAEVEVEPTEQAGGEGEEGRKGGRVLGWVLGGAIIAVTVWVIRGIKRRGV